MKTRIIHIIIFCLAVTLTQAQQSKPVNILFVLDASSSMDRPWGKKEKWEIAKETLTHIADSISAMPNVKFGLRAYGSESLPIKNDCEDTELKLPIGKHKMEDMIWTLNGINPKGITPLAYTLLQSANDFTNKNERNILILLTDGAESCSGNPCEISKKLQAQNITLKPFVIGLDIPENTLNEYRCIGNFNNTKTAAEFQEVMERVIDQTLFKTSVQLNLNNSQGQPTETNVPFSFVKAKNNEYSYTFQHRLNEYKHPDTFYINPAFTYNLVIHSLPPKTIKNVVLNQDEHNLISTTLPQGKLHIQSKNKLVTLVYKPQEKLSFHHQKQASETYLVGNYEIAILTLPTTRKTITVNEHKTTTINIANPGYLEINCSEQKHGALLYKDGNSWIKFYDLSPGLTTEKITLQPGEYTLLYRLDKDRTMLKSVRKRFTIISDETVELNF